MNAEHVTIRSHGMLPDGSEARVCALRSPNGFQADICDFGGRLVRLLAPDRNGRLADVVLGFNDAATYAAGDIYIGALIGRVANRIGGAKFTLDGRTHQLAANDRPGGHPCHLHGGVRGFSHALWHATPASHEGLPALRLTLTSVDGEEGYPGMLRVEVLYTLTAGWGLRIDYTASTDRPTPVNLSNHAYFNLAGEGEGTVLDHIVTIRARHYTPVNSGLIPTGVIAPVAGTPLDFTTARSLGERIKTPLDQLRFADGYNQNYVLDAAAAPDGLVSAATVYEPNSGRVMEVLTTEPCLQLYAANHFDGGLTGKAGRPYPQYAGFALETQRFPDAVNQPQFPDTILRPGQSYRSTTVYRFSVRD